MPFKELKIGTLGEIPVRTVKNVILPSCNQAMTHRLFNAMYAVVGFMLMSKYIQKWMGSIQLQVVKEFNMT